MLAAALTLLSRIPWQAWLVAAIVVMGGAYHLHAVHAAYDVGRDDYKATVEAANKAANDKADKGEANVKTCPLGKWSRETSTCALIPIVAMLCLAGCATPAPVDKLCGVITDALADVHAPPPPEGERRIDIHLERGVAAGCWTRAGAAP